MPLVEAKCTNCGAALTVDSSKDAAICEYCGVPYIVEKAINNINFNTNNSFSIGSAVISVQNEGPSIENLIKRAEEFEKQGDFKKAIEYYERILDLDINNQKARDSIDRINNTPLFTGLKDYVIYSATVYIYRDRIVVSDKFRNKIYPINTIISVKRCFTAFSIIFSTENKPLEFGARTNKEAKLIEQFLKNESIQKKYRNY